MKNQDNIQNRWVITPKLNEFVSEGKPLSKEKLFLITESKGSFYSPFNPLSGLDEVLQKAFVPQFNLIERELISRKFLSEDYKWLANKKTLCEFLIVIISHKYTKPKTLVFEINIRRFFEKRYGLEKNGLAEMFKPVKRPKFETSRVTFHFIDKPEKPC